VGNYESDGGESSIVIWNGRIGSRIGCEGFEAGSQGPLRKKGSSRGNTKRKKGEGSGTDTVGVNTQ